MNSPTVLAAALCCALSSCATNPLDLGYRSAPGVADRQWRNPNPSLVQTSSGSHDSSVRRYLSRGYRVIGFGSRSARYKIDPEHARMLAVERNADAAVFSRSYGGKRSERVAVPILTAAASQSSAYGDTSGYGSQSEAAGQTTVYGYRDEAYETWSHKTTLLRKD